MSIENPGESAPNLERPENYPNRKFFWRYQIQRDITADEADLIQAFTGINCHRYFEEEEFTLGSIVTPNPKVWEKGEPFPTMDFDGPNLMVWATKIIDEKFNKSPGVELALFGLEKKDELTDYDVSEWEENRARVEQVIDILGGVKIL